MKKEAAVPFGVYLQLHFMYIHAHMHNVADSLLDRMEMTVQKCYAKVTEFYETMDSGI